MIIRDLFPDFEKDKGLLQFAFDIYDNIFVLLETDIDECRALITHYNWCMSSAYIQENDVMKLHLRHATREGMERSLGDFVQCEEQLLYILNDPGAIIEHFLAIAWQFHDNQFNVAMESVKRHVKNLKDNQPSLVGFVHRFQEIMNVDRIYNFALMKKLSTASGFETYLKKHAIESRISVGDSQTDTLVLLGNCYHTSPKNIETSQERLRYLYHMFLFARKKCMHNVPGQHGPSPAVSVEPNWPSPGVSVFTSRVTQIPMFAPLSSIENVPSLGVREEANASVFASRVIQIPIFAPLSSIENVDANPAQNCAGYVERC